jgi:hypothetical protein
MKQQSLQLFVHSDWNGLWDKNIVAPDPSTARSRHGFILEYCGCPMLWASQLQTEIALSKALCEAIPIMNIMCMEAQTRWDDV